MLLAKHAPIMRVCLHATPNTCMLVWGFGCYSVSRHTAPIMCVCVHGGGSQVLHVAAEQQGLPPASPPVKACLRIRKPSPFMLAFLVQVRPRGGA